MRGLRLPHKSVASFTLGRVQLAVCRVDVGAMVDEQPGDMRPPGLAAAGDPLHLLVADGHAQGAQLVKDDRVAPGCVWLESGYGASTPLLAQQRISVEGAA